MFTFRNIFSSIFFVNLLTIQTSRNFSNNRRATMHREILKKILNQEQNEGVGAKVRRSIGGHEIRNYDPFLLLDYFNAGKPAGFPDHPHRGFETVTYVITGSFAHEDFVGHKGVIGPGDLQWMTAGRGIVHCEMPHGNEPGIGLQLWVNLSKQNKMIPPSYQELKDTQIPRASKNGVHVKIIAGESMGIKSQVYTRTPTMYLDFKLDKNAVYTQEIPTDWNALIFILSGKGEFGNSTPIEASAYHTLLLTKGETVSFKNNEETQLHIVLIAGQPLNEPIVQHGPFVMNTREEIQQAFSDYQNGKNGFENAKNWSSDYVKSRGY